MLAKTLRFKFLHRSHTLIGLVVLFFFYMSTYFGTLTFFMPYLKVWESPSRHFVPMSEHAFNIDLLLGELLEKQHLLGSKPIEITLPSFRDPLLKLSSESQNSLYLNPLSNEVIKLSKEENLISTFFNELHTGVVIPLIGTPLMGMMSIGIVFLTLGGFWLYLLKQKPMKKPKEGWKSRWLSWHKIMGLGIIPYALVFACTGAFLGLMLSYSHPFAWSASSKEESSMRKLVSPIIFAQPVYKSSETKAIMLPFSTLQTIANEQYPTLAITNATLYHYGTDAAKVRFRGFDKNNVAQSGRINRLSITLDARNGAMVEKRGLENTHGINQALSVFYYLHFVPDETLGVRIVLACFGVALAFCLATGYLLWAEKNLHQKGWLGDLTNRVSIAVLIGILPSSALVLWLQWLLAFDLFDKEVWIRGAFYAFWSFWLFYTVFERSLVTIIGRMLKATAWLLVLAVLFHGLKSGFFFWNSFEKGAWTLFGMDVMFLISALLCFVLAKAVEKKELFYRYECKGVFDGY